MRQAAQTIMAGFFLTLCPLSPIGAYAADTPGTLAQARRLVDAQNYAQAATLLEDLLVEADASDRRSILDLLHRSYDAMARQAKAAGNDREAAHLLDNIAIIEKSRGPAAAPANSPKPKPKPKPEPTAPITSPKPAIPETRTKSANTPANPTRMSPRPSVAAPAQDSVPEIPPEPAPPPEPLKKPSVKALAPLPMELEPSSPATRSGAPASSPDKPNPDDRSASGAARQAPAAVAPKDDPPISPPDNKAGPLESKPKPKPAAVSLAEGDRLFTAGRYEEAGRCYEALARDNALPAYRKQHWAYCRMVEVVNRINLRPQSAKEWDEIAAEIGNIQRLTPNIWYGEYLRNKVAEVRRSGRRPLAKSENLVVRASAPDENQPKAQADSGSRRFPRLFGKSRSGATGSPDPKSAAAAPSATGELPLKLPGGSTEPGSPLALNAGAGNDRGATGITGEATPSEPTLNATASPRGAGNEGAGITWQTYETPNFRVFHQNARLAESAANAAESVRADQARRWASPTADRPWTPRCDLYLYPTGKVFARETNQPESSPGFSTMMCNGNRVVARRMNLRADHPLLVTAILPHEVTHVVLADLFTTQQIPRWADEGIAVLAEPNTEQEIRAAELQEPLENGRVFDLRKLMAMDYPDAKDWSLYYAQSVSLTRFLVDQGPPAQFVQFVQNSQRDGIEGALRGTYGIAGLAELQDRWTAYARRRSAAVKQARREPGAQSDETVVK